MVLATPPLDQLHYTRTANPRSMDGSYRRDTITGLAVMEIWMKSSQLWQVRFTFQG